MNAKSRLKRWLFGSVILTVAVGGCESELDLSPEGLPVFSTGERRVLHRSDALAIPVTSGVVGDHLIVIDHGSDSTLHVLDRSDGRLLVSYGRDGEGPGEFKTALHIDADRTANGFWVYDIRLARMTYIDLDRLLIAPDSVVPMMLNLQASTGRLTAPVWTSEGSMLSPGFFEDDHRLAQLDSNGVHLGLVGPPPAGDPQIATIARQQMHQGTTAANSSHDRIAVASRWIPRIEMYDQHGALLTVADVPIEWDLSVTEVYSTTVWAVGQDMRHAYISVTASNRRVFALFSGRSHRSHPENDFFGNIVHAFDWQGRFLGYIPLAADAITISVDPEGSTLYTLEWEPLPTVGAYRLTDQGGR